MTTLQIIFYIFSAIAIASGVMVVISKNAVRCVLFLVLTFFSAAGLWILLHAEFLALILVLVYVGAVMTLFLFVVMMLNLDFETLQEGFVKYLPVAVLIVIMTLGLVVMVVGPHQFGLMQITPSIKPNDYNNLTDLGSVLYTDYAYPFEIGAVVLLTAIIAAISLTHRRPHQRRSQNTSEQIAVRRGDRVKLIKMASEKKNKSSGVEN